MSLKAQILSCFFVFLLAAGSSSPAHAAPETLCQGPLWDLRFGEAVVGSWGLSYSPATTVYINGQRQKIGNLEKAEQLSILRGCPAFCIVDEKGEICTIDIVAPQKSAEVGSIGKVSAERTAVRAGETITLEMKAPLGGKASFTVTGVERSIVAQEVQPGLYRALWRVPALALHNGYVLGQWQKGEETWYRWGDKLDIVTAKPNFLHYGPREVSAEAPTVGLFAHFEAGTAIDPQQVHIWVNEREVSRCAKRLSNALYCVLPRVNCPDGALVCVKISDNCGQSAKQYWRVQQR